MSTGASQQQQANEKPLYYYYRQQGDLEQGLIHSQATASHQAQGGSTAAGQGERPEWEKAVRHGFIQKVFGILTIQLLITTAISSVFVVVEPIEFFVINNYWTVYLAIVLSLVVICALAYSETLRRKHPINIIVLFIFTLIESYLVGVICALAQAQYVLGAFAITVAIVLVLTIYATQTKYDFTLCGGLLFGFLIALMFATILGIFFFQDRIYYAVISGAGALLMSLYLVYDVQLVVGGKRYELDPDEYVLGALTLYIDIINMFLYILSFFSR